MGELFTAPTGVVPAVPVGFGGPLVRAPLVADLAYELAIAQMRTGMNPLKKHFNALLFEDVWLGSETRAADASEV